MRQGQWLRVAGVNVVLKEDQNMLLMEIKRTVFERRYLRSFRHDENKRAKPTQSLHLPLNHRQKRMVETIREERLSEAGVHLGC